MTAQASRPVPPTMVVHLAGHPEDGVQCCARCGDVLVDLRNTSSIGGGRSWWSVGHPVGRLGNMTTLLRRNSALQVSLGEGVPCNTLTREERNRPTTDARRFWPGFQNLPGPVPHPLQHGGLPLAVLGMTHDAERGLHVIWSTVDGEASGPAWTRVMLFAGFRDRTRAEDVLARWGKPDPQTFFRELDGLADARTGLDATLHPFEPDLLAEVVGALKKEAARALN